MSLISPKVAMTRLSRIGFFCFLYMKRPSCIHFPDLVGMNHLLRQQTLNVGCKVFSNLIMSGLCKR